MAASAHEPLAKQYDPKAAQARWLQFWDDKNYFHSVPDPSRTPYTIVIPPPNVTGALHMGHALNNTLQDVLIRWRRAQGYNAEWMPGTDHAGIATQAVVERLIFQQENKTRYQLDPDPIKSREMLVARIWEWKEKYENRILGQLKQLGCSCDWQRTRFTFDEGCSRAVRVTFFNWFREGYIYRGKRLVNWDPQLQTSVSDDETYTDDVKGGFWTFKYPVKPEPGASAPGEPEFIRFSTTRPETMLGDSAICVHPNDDRYKHLIGKTVTVPLVGRDIPIIADGLLADPTLGTGAVKVTPAHDPNDYACWQRHPEIAIINILNPDGTINENGGKYAGLDRYKAREAVAADMEALGLFEGREDRVIPLKYSDRSKSPIEPYLSDQWFVKMGDRDDGKPGLAQMTMDTVTSGRVKFFPERYAKTYLDWLGEKRDWCISRQLWWGHQIPVWYKTEAQAANVNSTVASPTPNVLRTGPHEWRNHVVVVWDQNQSSDNQMCFQVCIAPGHEDIERALEADGFQKDPDVLDTWFSSQLWPHSTFGWPDDTPELRYYYPNNTLVTSRDIITLWVARMVLSGLSNMGDVPFHEVYITPKLLDGFGETMSKSKGNGVDPLDIIDRYGADALRYQMVYLAGDTQDSRLPVANVCPHCDTLVPVKAEHMSMRTRKITCPNCKKPFRPGGPWPMDDPELPTAKQASDKFEQGRNFANKLWNAARFLMLNLEAYTPGPVEMAALPVEDRWVLSRLAATTAAITDQLEGYRFAELGRTIYEFIWTEFCDWYVEMSKNRLRAEQHPEPGASAPGGRSMTQRVLVGVLDAILRLVQPVMPFVAESIWQALDEVAPERGLPGPTRAAESVCVAPWPNFPAEWRDADIETRIGRMQELVRGVREVRNRYNVEPRTELAVSVRCRPEVADDFRALGAFIQQLAGVGAFAAGPETVKAAQSAGIVHADFEAYVSLAGLIDVGKESQRLEKQIAEKRKLLQATQAKLGNASFVAKAPAEVVQQQQQQVAELESQIQTLEQNQRELGG